MMVLHVPEYSSAQVDIVLNEPHSTVTRRAAFVVIANNVVGCRIRVGTQDEIPCLIGREAEENV
jgi:hypothetical protein